MTARNILSWYASFIVVLGALFFILLLFYNDSADKNGSPAVTIVKEVFLPDPLLEILSMTAVQSRTIKPEQTSKKWSFQLQDVILWPCSVIPLELKGPLDVDLAKYSWPQIEEKYIGLEAGGHGKPKHCIAQHRVAIIVPYRNREYQLKVFVNHLHGILNRQQLDYVLIVVEPIANQTFNRAKLMNIGYMEALKAYPWECFVFTDVDLLPEDDRILYSCPVIPRHMSAAIDIYNYSVPYSNYFGGVMALTVDQMRDLNGFSNDYWGWGGEDDDLLKRVYYAGYTFTRYPASVAKYKMHSHKHAAEEGNNENEDEDLISVDFLEKLYLPMPSDYVLVPTNDEDGLTSQPKHPCQNIGRTVVLSICFLFFNLLLLFLLCLWYSDSSLKSTEPKSRPNVSTPFARKLPQSVKKLIRTWTEPTAVKMTDPERNVTIFAVTKWYGEEFSNANFIENQCSKTVQAWCRITTSSTEAIRADAFLFHNIDFNQTLYPKERNPSQIYVMITMESPIHEEIHFQPDQINWTMNYRRDSDVDSPYFILKQTNNTGNVDYNAIWSMKNNTAAWIVTNCNAANKRREVIEKMKLEGLEIDIFGACGTELNNCGRFAPDRNECAANVIKNYKFYIAFENSNCPNYVTEKLYNAFSLFFAIPIVIKRSIYEDIGIPSLSFIALDDFGSIKQLVKFISDLQNDKEQYLKYHKWRENNEAKKFDDSIRFCDLCKKLRSGGIPRQSYLDMKEWYSKDACNNSAAFRYLQ